MGEVHAVSMSAEPTPPDAPDAPDAPEAVDQPEPVEEQAESSIPDKFKNEDGEVDVQALLSSYEELEKKLGSGPTEEVAEETEAAPEPEAEEQAEESEAPQSALNRFSEEYFETGGLKEESFEALEGLGYPRDLVEAFIAGQQALITGEQDRLYAEVGGSEAYARMSEWASHNMTDEAKEAYNAAVQSGDFEQASLAVRGLRDTYIRSEGAQPNLVQGRSSAGPAVAGFRSTAELVKAMSDPRYSKDPAYREDVEARLRASNQL